MRSVRLRHNTGQPLSSVSLSSEQTFAATGCGSHVDIVALGVSGAREHVTMQLKATGRFTVTDVAFAPQDPGIVAASGTNGMVAVFDFNTSRMPSSTHGRYSCQWDSGETPRSMNKVSWHPDNSSVLLSSGMDGLVRLYDLRHKQECQGVFNPRSEATRDVAFNPFNASLFAALSENGALSVWDCRNVEAPILKISAHTMFGLSLAWNPSQRDIIATGSRDKTVKVWDIQQASWDGRAHEEATSAAAGVGVAEKEGMGKEAHKPVHLIHTGSSVGRIRWRSGDKFRHQLATAAQSTESQGGEIMVWNTSMPNTPACVLKGHSETCTDFAWLDTPLADSDVPSSKSSRDSAAAMPADGFLGVHQHILSVGKDGMLLVQDIRNAYFPRQHMSASVTAISSQGHVAFQRGTVLREDPIGLLANRFTERAPGWFSDAPSCFGMKIPSTSPEMEAREAALAASAGAGVASKDSSDGKGEEEEAAAVVVGQEAGNQDAKLPQELTEEQASGAHDATASSEGGVKGQVFLGLASIRSLGHARDIRRQLRHGAEGGVFDPAMMSLLARSYQCGTNSRADPAGNNSGVSACQHNLQVAKQAGLHCRAGVWSTALSIICSFISSKAPPTPPGGDATGGMSDQRHGSLAELPLPLPHSGSDMPATLPFGEDILGSLLQELLEGGDCQHFVVLCEVLKHAGMGLLDSVCATTDISTMQRREVYLAYFELLGQMRLFSCVNSIIKDSDEEYISRVSRHGVSMHTACAKCGKELPDGIPWCKKCNGCAAMCSLCHRPVRGLMHWCPVCGHGGHIECSRLWFKYNSTCPSGCGHDCSSQHCYEC